MLTMGTFDLFLTLGPIVSDSLLQDPLINIYIFPTVYMVETHSLLENLQTLE